MSNYELQITHYQLKRQEVYMTKCRTNKKVHTFRGAAALIIAAFFTLAAMAFTACKQPTVQTATSKYKVTFNVDGGGHPYRKDR